MIEELKWRTVVTNGRTQQEDDLIASVLEATGGLRALVITGYVGSVRKVVHVQVGAGLPDTLEERMELLDRVAAAPKVSVTNAALRALGLGGVLSEQLATYGQMRQAPDGASYSSHGVTVAINEETLRAIEYVPDAVAYANLTREGALNPAAIMAERAGISFRTQQGRISRARKLGILTPAVHGRAGGELTPLGAALLELSTPINKEK